MRVLHVNKFGWEKGGAEAYMLRACERLAALPDVEVGLWAAEPAVLPDVRLYDTAIPDFRGERGIRGKFDMAATVIWSRSAQRRLNETLDDFAPDIVHLHNYAHQFSSSIVELLRRERIPTVATAHDYKLICPAYLGVRDGRDCFDCAAKLSLMPLRARCLHRQTSWSAVALVEAKVVRERRLTPDVVLAPSRFMLDRLESGWLRSFAMLRLLRYPVDPSGVAWEGGDYLLYAGRLSAEKGVDDLILRARLSLPLVIAGDGSERERLEALAASAPEVSFAGHVGHDTLVELRRRCLAQVVPSTWPENFPLTALEAAVDGVPLILSNRGGAPELLELGARGALIETSDAPSWRRAVDRVRSLNPLSDLDQLDGLRDRLSWKRHLPNLMGVYEQAQAAPPIAANRRRGLALAASRKEPFGGH